MYITENNVKVMYHKIIWDDDFVWWNRNERWDSLHLYLGTALKDWGDSCPDQDLNQVHTEYMSHFLLLS
jgi:hypothetical protein